MQTYLTRSEEETIALGEKLAQQLPARAVVLLIGNLGAGKTTLAKGIVKGLGAAVRHVAEPFSPEPGAYDSSHSLLLAPGHHG